MREHSCYVGGVLSPPCCNGMQEYSVNYTSWSPQCGCSRGSRLIEKVDKHILRGNVIGVNREISTSCYWDHRRENNQLTEEVRKRHGPLSGLKAVKPPVEFGERTRDCSPGHAGKEGHHLAMKGASRGFS